MKSALIFIALILTGFATSAQQMHVKHANYQGFSSDKKHVTELLERRSSATAKKHPEYGVLPYNAQCKECVELIDKRTLTTRQFIDINNPKRIYSQSSYFPLHYQNSANDIWRTIDLRLRPESGHPGIYSAKNQPVPTKYDATLHTTSLTVKGFEFEYNKNLSLYFFDENSVYTKTEAGNYSNSTIGEEGVEVKNVWSGIDMQQKFSVGKIETNFIISAPLHLPISKGWMVIEDHFTLPIGYRFEEMPGGERSKEGYYRGDYVLRGPEGDSLVIYEKPVYVDAKAWGMHGFYQLNRQGNDYTLQTLVPVEWLNNPDNLYPLLIDPLTFGTTKDGDFRSTSLNSANLGFTSVSMGSCNYNMTVQVYGNSTLRNAYVDLEYELTYDNTCGNPPLQAPYCTFSQVYQAVVCNACNTSTGNLVCNPAQPPYTGTCTTDSVLVPGAHAINIESFVPNYLSCIPFQVNDYFIGFTLKNQDSVCLDQCGYLCARGNLWQMTVVADVNGPLTADPGPDQTVCSGSNIILDPNISGGVPPYTFAWSSTGSALVCPNCTFPSCTITQNSTYSVTVTDAANATASASVNYAVNGGNNNVQIAFANTNVSCSAPMDTTTVTVTGGTPPYTFSWDPGDSTNGSSPQVHLYSAPQAYVISVKDASGCVTAGIDSVLNLGLTVAISGALQPNCMNDSTGQLTGTPTGGSPPYTYLWSNTATTSTINNLVAGTYSLTVTDSLGCQWNQYHILYPVYDNFNFYPYLTATDDNCGVTGSVSCALNGGTPPFAFLWSNGDSSQNLTNLGGGDYSVTVTDSVGCKVYGHAPVNVVCISHITGIVFSDTNNNCILDSGEIPLQGIIISAYSPGGAQYYGYTDSNGFYSIPISDTGLFTMQIPFWGYADGSCSTLSLCGNNTQSIYVPVLGNTYPNNNFASTISNPAYNLGIHPGWNSGSPGFEKDYWIYYYNTSQIAYNGPVTLTFDYDPNLQFLASIPPPTSNDTINHILTWVDNSFQNDSGWNEISYIQFNIPPSLPLYYQLQSTFRIDPTTGDCDSSDNIFQFSELVTGSHDPNEKDVVPVNNISPDDSVLTYTIHFQNDGNDSTQFIVVKDTLSPNLDPGTVRNLASNPRYSGFDISGRGILTWTFNPLHLVDSLTNPDGSKGFITFRVNKKHNLNIGSIISNSATIYFDYNTGIVTNTVSDTVRNTTGIIEPLNANTGIIVKAFPNPFKTAVTIVVDGLNEKYDFELFDLTGRLVKRITGLETRQFEVQRDLMSTGIYIYRISAGNRQLAHGKLAAD